MVKSSSHLVLMSVRLVSHNPFFSILLFWFTNSCCESIQLFQEEIFASSFAAAAYLKSIDFPKDKKASNNLFYFLQWGFVIIVWLWLWRLWDVVADNELISVHDL
jgi:hypothetical protein